MPTPDYQSIMLPIIVEGDIIEHLIREAIEHVANIINLSKKNEERIY
jgi:hypothetical protein